MIKPEFITFTGIDDRTDLTRADRLASKYLIEWGVLLSEKNKDARYPCAQAIEEILEVSGTKSAHLCGRLARDFQKRITPRYADLHRFSRIQVNGYQINTEHFTELEDVLGVEIITQSRSVEFEESEFLSLFDCSGGEGIMPTSVPKSTGEKIVGYAGGMGPDTVLDYLRLVECEGPFWIDMEGRVRTNGWFDLDKVERVCQSVFDY